MGRIIANIYGSLKVQNLTIQTPQETLQETPTTLPTSEPGAGSEQISYTVAAADLPAFSATPDSQKLIGLVIGAGKFVTAGTVNYRMKKNGSSVATGNSAVAANTYYTVHAYFYNVAIGDVLALSLWSNKTDSNWDYNAYQIHPTRCLPKTTAPVLSPFKLTTFTAYPTLTQGVPSSVGAGTGFLFHEDLFSRSQGSALNLVSLRPAATYGFYQVTWGDATSSNSASITTSATYRPYYRQSFIPSTYSYRVTQVK